MMSGQPPFVSVEFALEKLREAGSAKRKLLQPTRPLTETEFANFIKGNARVYTEDEQVELKKSLGVNLNYDNSEIEFNPDEIVILKDLFDAKKKWSSDLDLVVLELKDIFSPPKPVPTET